jgi:hypothetical protein
LRALIPFGSKGALDALLKDNDIVMPLSDTRYVLVPTNTSAADQALSVRGTLAGWITLGDTDVG